MHIKTKIMIKLCKVGFYCIALACLLFTLDTLFVLFYAYKTLVALTIIGYSTLWLKLLGLHIICVGVTYYIYQNFVIYAVANTILEWGVVELLLISLSLYTLYLSSIAMHTTIDYIQVWSYLGSLFTI